MGNSCSSDAREERGETYFGLVVLVDRHALDRIERREAAHEAPEHRVLPVQLLARSERDEAAQIRELANRANQVSGIQSRKLNREVKFIKFFCDY